MGVIDLHCHTTASDGTLSPTQLVQHAARREVDVIGVTDHDTVEGIDEARRAGDAAGVRVVAGIEVSSRADDRSVHVLGFFLDPSAPAISGALRDMRSERADRMRRMVERLRELGCEITLGDVEEQAAGAILARPHVARALVARGCVRSVKEAFTKQWIGDGGRAEVPRRQISPFDAVDLVSSAGGVAVLAHPGLAHHLGTHDPLGRPLIEDLARHGLGGLEVDHPDHAPHVRRAMRKLADELGLIATGGSDFHGESGRPLGTATTSPESLAALELRAGG